MFRFKKHIPSSPFPATATQARWDAEFAKVKHFEKVFDNSFTVALFSLFIGGFLVGGYFASNLSSSSASDIQGQAAGVGFLSALGVILGSFLLLRLTIPFNKYINQRKEVLGERPSDETV